MSEEREKINIDSPINKPVAEPSNIPRRSSGRVDK
jgi:hypothetical protein